MPDELAVGRFVCRLMRGWPTMCPCDRSTPARRPGNGSRRVVGRIESAESRRRGRQHFRRLIRVGNSDDRGTLGSARATTLRRQRPTARTVAPRRPCTFRIGNQRPAFLADVVHRTGLMRSSTTPRIFANRSRFGDGFRRYAFRSVVSTCHLSAPPALRRDVEFLHQILSMPATIVPRCRRRGQRLRAGQFFGAGDAHTVENTSTSSGRVMLLGRSGGVVVGVCLAARGR